MRVKILLLLIAAFYFSSTPSPKAASPFHFRAGVGYDYLSQEFFQDSLVASGADSSFVSFLLRNEYLNDPKGIFSVHYAPEKKPFEATLTYEQTHDRLRLTGAPNFRFMIGRTKLQVINELEWRDNVGGNFDESSYLLGSSRAGINSPISNKLNLIIQASIDGVNFTSQQNDGIDYYRLGAKTGVSYSFSEMTFLEARFLAATRQVPDSLRLEYQSFGGDVSLFHFGENINFDLYGFVENKDYKADLEQDDLTHCDLSNRVQLNLSDHFFGVIELDGELDLFHKNDPYNTNVGRVQTAVLGGLTGAIWSAVIGPESEMLNQAGSSTAVEDYTEVGGRIDLEAISGDQFFISWRGSIGRRDVLHEDEIRSDFTYGRTNLIADFRLFGELRLNGLLSVDREWSDLPGGSGTTYIVSSSLLFDF